MMYFGSVKPSIIIALLVCSSLHLSCTHKKDQKNIVKTTIKLNTYQRVELDTSSVMITDTLYGDNDSISIKKTKCYLKPHAITQLPFGFKVTKQNFAKTRELFADLESGHGNQVNGGRLHEGPKREIKNYVLPHIKKITYIPLPDIDTDRCENGTTFNSLLKFNKYQYRLPDMNKYQCYYFTEFDNSHHYSGKINSSCGWGLIESFYVGYLILYDQKTQNAQVIKIYRDTFQDGADLHTVFYIDQHKRIELNRFSAPSDDDGDDPSHPIHDDTIIININKVGKITLKKTDIK